jgi:hypothetical protein
MVKIYCNCCKKHIYNVIEKPNNNLVYETENIESKQCNNEKFEKYINLQMNKNQLMEIGVPSNIADLVLDLDNKYIEDYKQRIMNGQDYVLAYSVVANLVLADKLKEKDEIITKKNLCIDKLTNKADALENGRVNRLIDKIGILENNGGWLGGYLRRHSNKLIILNIIVALNSMLYIAYLSNK